MHKQPTTPDRLTVRQFFERFPNEDACLHHIMSVRFGLRHVCRKCGVESTFHQLKNRKRAFSCANCGDHIYPTADTVFQDTRTPLVSWFYAIYLFVTTRHGVSGKELERNLGVTYKTAYRMGMQIRKLIAKADGFQVLQGHIQADEAYVGGRRSGGKRGRGAPGKTIVMAMKSQDRINTEVIPNIKKATLRDVILRNVAKGSTVSTDELMSYGLLTGDGYTHGVVNHGRKEWSYYDYRHDAFHTTNAVESFWRLFKNSVRSTHIHVSEKHMASYLGEFAFRSNHRVMKNAMFDLLIGAI